MGCICGAFFEYVGFATILYFAYHIACFIHRNYVAKVDIAARYKKAGSWAIITGASDGIGRALTIEIARRGMNVALIARNQAKMDAVVAEVARYKVTAKTFVFDFAAATPEAYTALFKQLGVLDIGLLVNNVGVNYDSSAPFDTVPVSEDVRLIKVNCESMVAMTKFIIPIFKQKRCGGIINLSSIASLRPTPYLATYSATKAFNKLFSDSLRAELQEFNIDVMTVMPNFVVSNMTQGGASRRPKESFMMVNADVMARDTIRQLGTAASTTGHRNHQILEAIFFFIPTMLWNKMILSLQKTTYRRNQARKTPTPATTDGRS